MRWVLAALLPVAAVPLVASAGDGVPVAVIDGFGWGHGVGMAQDGALQMGRDGTDVAGILRHFYPGTRLGAASGEVRVSIATSPSREALLAFPAGGEVHEVPPDSPSPGFPVRVPPGGQASVRFDGRRYWVAPYNGPGPGPGLVVESSGGASSPGAPEAREVVRALDLPVTWRLAPLTDVPRSATTTSTLPFPSAPALPTTTTTLPGPLATPTTTAPQPATTTSTSPPAASAPGPPPPAAPPPPAGTGSPRTPPSTRRSRRLPLPPPPPPPVGVSTTRALRAIPPEDNTVLLPAVARRYRGAIEAIGVAARRPYLALFNRLDVETYLRGMGEVLDPSWPKASLAAQAIAARTYALRTMAARGEICSGQRCQVYFGQQAEYRAMDEAVTQTAGQVLMFRNRLASAVYSANAAGVSASREEGFGPLPEGSDAEFPYLRTAPYPTGDRFPWTVTVALADVARRLRYPGELTSLVIGRTGPSGRVLEIAADGTSGPRNVPGLEFAGALGLRSTLFSARVDLARSVPPLPAPEALQTPPGDAAAMSIPGGVAAHRGPVVPWGAIVGRWLDSEGTRVGGQGSAVRFPFWSCLAPGLALLGPRRKLRAGSKAGRPGAPPTSG